MVVQSEGHFMEVLDGLTILFVLDIHQWEVMVKAELESASRPE